jgi:hypothetical protein
VQLGMRRPRHSSASAELVRLTAITRRDLRVIAPVVEIVLLPARCPPLAVCSAVTLLPKVADELLHVALGR